MAELIDGEERARRPGRPMKELGLVERNQILDLLRSGNGRRMACLTVGLDYARFRRHLRDDPAFAREVRTAERSRSELCERFLYRMVVEANDTPVKLRAAIAYLARRDRLEEGRRARAERARRRVGAAPDGA